MSDFKTRVRSLQIEITSRCNLSCVYCPHGAGSMRRFVKDMDAKTWAATMHWVRAFVERGTQTEINLTGIGEPTLHPAFPDMVLECRLVLGPGKPIIIATNGVAMTKRIVDLIAPAQPEVHLSLHRPDKAAFALPLLRDAGILKAATMDPAVAPNDWAGQVAWIPAAYVFDCCWLRDGKAFVASTGDILACCIDAGGYTKSGGNVVTHEPGTVSIGPSSLCRRCYHHVACYGPGFDQTAG